MLPEIWSVLKHRNISIRWTIHGQGPDEAALRRGLAEASQAGEVNFSPPVPLNQLGDMIRRHDVFIVTSRHEAGPITLVEAMGHGLVPVCADIPCLIQEMVNLSVKMVSECRWMPRKPTPRPLSDWMATASCWSGCPRRVTDDQRGLYR